MSLLPTTAEGARLREDQARSHNWKRWGPYLAERQWGTVREDYSANGDAWNYFPFDHAASRAYRWGEDGLLGWTDRECRLCFALALWNGQDGVLKERLYGLNNHEGNHGEDVKECYFYLESTPTHSYAKALYKYPQTAFPYEKLRLESAQRSREVGEYELGETGVFDEGRYFDVQIEYAKDGPDDTLIRLTISNRGPEAAPLHVLPTLWYRNAWTWDASAKPAMQQQDARSVAATHGTLGEFRYEIAEEAPWLFTENETNNERLFHVPNASPFVKDAFERYLVHGETGAVNPAGQGTKVAPHYALHLAAGETRILKLRLRPASAPGGFVDFDHVFLQRYAEMEEFYASKLAANLTAAQEMIIRQAYAGLLWTKQYYNYVVKEWLHGDPATPPPPPGHALIRNADWEHLYNSDVISMPDKWEYPWYAAWDLCFHMLPFARIDAQFAQEQLQLMLREWYMHPSGRLPAYEWNFNDVNPPVHAWACWRVYKIAGREDERDSLFLERCFQKLLVNFTWWVNRKDVQGRHVFAGGFLGLDNIGLFDRSQPLPNGRQLAQADGTAWMAFYCGTMLSMALELALTRPAYEDIASKFFEHFVQIVDAINGIGAGGLWDEQDGFYYDQILLEGDGSIPLRVRSLVGLIPLLAVEILDQETIDRLPGFKKRLKWFIKNRPDLSNQIAYLSQQTNAGKRSKRLLAIPSRERLERVLRVMLDEKEFLSPHGIRSLSAAYREEPYHIEIDGVAFHIGYNPAESKSDMFGGNSNWRGPVWIPMNYLLIEALERYHEFYGADFQMEFPTGSGVKMTLQQIASEIAGRLESLFIPDEKGRRPCFGDDPRFAQDPHWRDLIWFFEYFDGDHGAGLGANHQTGWSALITRLIAIHTQQPGA